jgi:hypothetical protein
MCLAHGVQSDTQWFNKRTVFDWYITERDCLLCINNNLFSKPPTTTRQTKKSTGLT